jgi:hypothetical protein
MTLIVGILTNGGDFLVCDRMHSLDGTKENPVTATLKNENQTIKITSPHIRINTGTKIYKLNDHILIGGSGDYNKIQKYIESIKNESKDTIIKSTYNYYKTNKQESPDQMLILLKDEIVTADVFYHNQNTELYSFINCQFQINDINLGVLAIGSGGPLFLTMYNHIKEKCINEYKEFIAKNEYEKWKEFFLEKIRQMYIDVSKYDDAVSSDVEIYKL